MEVLLKYLNNFSSDSFKNSNYQNEEYKYIIATFDLRGSLSSSVYKEIDEELEACGLKKHIQKKVKDENEKRPYRSSELPKNTYVTKAVGADYKNINNLRDTVESTIRGILEFQLDSCAIEGFNYFIFIANEWSWATGSRQPSNF